MDGIASTPEKKEKYIKTIYSKANDMSVLVDELLVFQGLTIIQCHINLQM